MFLKGKKWHSDSSSQSSEISTKSKSQDGKLPFVPLEKEFIMRVSKYDIKVSTSDQHDILHRHALYLIIWICYDDGLQAGKSLLALKTTDTSNDGYSLWVYQCNSLE
ncbi:integrin beta-1-binding protein 1-like [Nycticebus coucang]|uniref:integrin beta-1-binding protein 1-like n=1 Tax=Nycticebus coucang TaxID=9470 RepID=UPI00234E2F95|nr:integrin beta-1-binding protein 1-like [Nycticebus coucang]